MSDDPLNLQPAINAMTVKMFNDLASSMTYYRALLMANTAPRTFQTLIHHEGKLRRATLIVGLNDHGFFNVSLIKPVKMSHTETVLFRFSLS